MNLPAPPFLEYWLFENPIAPALTLLLIGIALLFFRRGNITRQISITATVAMALAVGLFGLASFVETDRERLASASELLVERVEEGDMARIRELFDDRAILTGPNGETWRETDGLFNELEYIIDKYKVRNAVKGSVKAQFQQPTNGKTQFTVRTALYDDDSRSVLTTWQVRWRLSTDGHWRISELQWLKLNGMAPSNGIWR